MKRTTILAEEQALYRVRQLADERGVTVSEIIREAVDEKLEREQPELTFLGADGSTGSASGGTGARDSDEQDRYRPDDFRG